VSFVACSAFVFRFGRNFRCVWVEAVKGVLMDKATNQPLLANGKEVCAEKTFTAKKPNGTIDLEFTFDGYFLTLLYQLLDMSRFGPHH
jgi:hypothetical protein